MSKSLNLNWILFLILCIWTTNICYGSKAGNHKARVGAKLTVFTSDASAPFHRVVAVFVVVEHGGRGGVLGRVLRGGRVSTAGRSGNRHRDRDGRRLRQR